MAADEITRTYYAIGSALADYSAADGHHVFPSHRRLADDVHCSRSTVRRALKRLRELGLLEWEHRFVGPGPDRPLPRGTSNLYEFLLPADRLAKLGLRQPRPPRENNGGRTTPQTRHHRPSTAVHDRVASAVAAEVRLSATFEEARERVLAIGFIDSADVELLVHDELERTWQQLRGPAADGCP